MKITIITIVKNGSMLIEKTLQSVVAQSCQDFEYIVIDGGSDDGTIDIIKKYENKIATFISEEDKGISDAFNKGIVHSHGQWIMFLNAGDWFVKDSFLDEISEEMKNCSDMDIIYGKINVVNLQGKYLKTIGDAEYLKEIHWHMPFPHQATFHNRHLFDELGMYDCSYKRAMDYEFILRKKTIKVKYVPLVFTNMLAGGVSQTNYKALFGECARAHKKYFNDSAFVVWLHYAYMLWRVRTILFVRFLIRKEIK